MIREFIKIIPGIKFLIKTNTYKFFRHKLTQFISERENATFTYFLRLPCQFEALSGPVIEFLLSDNKVNNLRITILGCSNGAEAYSVASILRNRHPNLIFSIYAYDIDEKMIDKAKSACYDSEEEVFNNRMITAFFINDTFDIEKQIFKIKPEIAKLIHFDVVDALDPNLKKIIGTSDIVYAQNFLFHMNPKLAKMAFNNICNLLNPKAALFVDGMDLDIRQKLARINRLVPLEYKIEEIHNEARIGRSDAWPFVYWGIEPFLTSRKDWRRRYSTIFIKG